MVITTRTRRRARMALTMPQALHTPIDATVVQPKTHLEGDVVTLRVGTVLRREVRPDVPDSVQYVIVQNENRQRYEVRRDELDAALDGGI